jgi:hypothetical protein
MSPLRLLNLGIMPALAELARCGIPDTVDARRFILAIALQESRLAHRRQVAAGGVESGPAASFWQFEQGGGCKGVLTHYLVASDHAQPVRRLQHRPDPGRPVGGDALPRHHGGDRRAPADLHAAVASCRPLPAAGWDQYTAAWRPGKPHPETWASNWDLATLTTGAK